jgi:hypothetical protein
VGDAVGDAVNGDSDGDRMSGTDVNRLTGGLGVPRCLLWATLSDGDWQRQSWWASDACGTRLLTPTAMMSGRRLGLLV